MGKAVDAALAAIASRFGIADLRPRDLALLLETGVTGS